MGLREDVKKVTSLLSINNDTKFLRLQGLSQAAKDRKMNERKVRTPRNIRLVENSDEESDNDSNNYIDSKVRPNFDKHTISADIKEVNGGDDLSNEYLVNSWKENLECINNSKKEKSRTFLTCNDIKVQTGSKNLKYKLFRNAAFMGLVNIKKLSLQDLLNNENNESSPRKENKPECLESLQETAHIDTAINEGSQVLVPLHEDPDIFIHLLHMGINKEEFKDIDFTVAHVGKKRIETPLEYFVRTTTDDSFKFVKKQKKCN